VAYAAVLLANVAANIRRVASLCMPASRRGRSIKRAGDDQTSHNITADVKSV
jgi:hypothetical protein